MPKLLYWDGNVPRDSLFLQAQPQRRYGFFKFCGDAFMTLITGGLWLIWVLVRRQRRR